MLTSIKSNDLPSWTTRVTSGEVVHIRPVDESDADGLHRYFRSLSGSSRHGRFMAGTSEIPAHEIARMTDMSDVPGFMVVAEIAGDQGRHIVGEARCALAVESEGEFAVSVDDRWQRLGIGFALLAVVESCAERFRLKRLFGETLQSNTGMKSLAARAGFTVRKCPDDWSVSWLERKLCNAPHVPDTLQVIGSLQPTQSGDSSTALSGSSIRVG